jgi:hypothetical protein
MFNFEPELNIIFHSESVTAQLDLLNRGQVLCRLEELSAHALRGAQTIT